MIQFRTAGFFFCYNLHSAVLQCMKEKNLDRLCEWKVIELFYVSKKGERLLLTSAQQTAWVWTKHPLELRDAGLREKTEVKKKKKKSLQWSRTKSSQCSPGVFCLSDMLSWASLTTPPLPWSPLPFICPWHVKKTAKLPFTFFFFTFLLLIAKFVRLEKKKKHHRGAVHLALSARWCQDGRWPKACRTESSSESLFSLPVPPWHLPATGNLGEPFDRPRFQHGADAAQKFPVIQTNQGRWGMKLRPPASVFNGFQIDFPYILQSRWGASPLSRWGLRSLRTTLRLMPDTVFWLARRCLSHNLPLGWRRA